MVNPEFVENLNNHATREFWGQQAGNVAVFHGGLSVDHYQGLAKSLAAHTVPLYKQSYQASEFVYGWIPVNSPDIPALYYQIPVLQVKGKNIPGAAQLAALFSEPISETIVAPMVGITHRYLPLAALGGEGASARKAYKSKARWTPLLEALNNDKDALRANTPTAYEAKMGSYQVKVDLGSPIGLTQLAPYKGYTVMTRQAPPANGAGDNRPVYDFRVTHDHFLVIASFIAQHGRAGEEVGQQVVFQSNAAMMELLYKHVEDSIAARRPAPTPTLAQASAPADFPCPTCGKPVRQGFRLCPMCGQELVWG